MLDNTITFQVDELGNDTLVPTAYMRIEEYLGRSLYKSPSHSLEARDTLTVTRSMPKPSGNFRGVKKSAIKDTIDVTVPGVDATTSIVAPAIGAVNFSLPVGTSAATALLLRERLIAKLQHQDFITRLTEELEY